jgi:peptidylprolyl isomerase/FKBP-type peptidyl-prolyl cis-trans isomerase FklB
MKWIFKIFFLVTLLSNFSCDKDDDNEDVDVWKTANEQAFEVIKTNPEYKEIQSPGNEESIYYKVLSEGTGTKPIYYTSTVSIYLKGYYIVENDKLGIKKNDVFQRREFDDGLPVSILVSSPNYLPVGISVALQNMKKGDKWEVWIPYPLGFGRTTTSIPYDLYNTNVTVSISAYSTVAYEIEVVDIIL